MNKPQLDRTHKALCGTFGVRPFEYRTVDVTTLKGLKQAERLHSNGWATYSVGPFSIIFQREVI